MKNLFSGRFWLTVIAGGVFAFCSINKVLPPEAIATILAMVFSNYFNKGRMEDNAKSIDHQK